MNIFILDNDIEKCARAMIDKHIVKMPLEHAQMLSTACRISGVDYGYKATYKNHPCTIWTRTSKENFIYLVNLTLAIGKEYQIRYGLHKNHAAVEVVKEMPIPDLPSLGLTPFAQAMPVEYKHADAVQAYRAYYMGAKRNIATWKTNPPNWFI